MRADGLRVLLVSAVQGCGACSFGVVVSIEKWDKNACACGCWRIGFCGTAGKCKLAEQPNFLFLNGFVPRANPSFAVQKRLIIGCLYLDKRATSMAISKVIKQDAKAALLAAKDDDFRSMNIYSNRIMTNALFDNDPNPNFALIGFFFKETARMCGEMKASKESTAYSTAKSIVVNYIESVDVEGTNEKLWSDFADFYNKIRKYEEDEYEKESYEDAPVFTKSGFRWLSELINKERMFLYDSNSRYLTGVAVEMERIIRAHGGELHEICVVSLFKALSLYSNYLSYFDQDYRKEVIAKSFFSYLDSVVTIASKEEVDFGQVTKLLAKIIFDWRICYIRFLERLSIIPVEERKVPIAEETKKKLAESVEKALEQEVR